MSKNYLLTEHRKHIKYMNGHKNYAVADLTVGDIITFMYKTERRWVFVVTPIHEGKLHAIDLTKFPRLSLMKFANLDFSKVTPQMLYDKYLNKKVITEFGAYRTYDRSKIRAIKNIGYDRSVAGTEKDSAGIPDPEKDENI